MAAPVGVAQALPWLYTGAMYTARVRDALVTVLALPAIQTPARHTQSHAISLRGGTDNRNQQNHTPQRHMQNTETNSQNHSEVR